MSTITYGVIEFLEKNGLPFSTKIDSEPYKIRIKFEKNVNYLTKKHVIEKLRKFGFRQIGNTSSWILIKN